jgi:hypothetical protein
LRRGDRPALQFDDRLGWHRPTPEDFVPPAVPLYLVNDVLVAIGLALMSLDKQDQ